MRRFMTFLAGALCGALVGSVTALLLAPYSGEDLQGRIRDQAESVSGEIRAAYDSRMAQLEAELESLRKSVKAEAEPKPSKK
jgi:gas vesicle protein